MNIYEPLFLLQLTHFYWQPLSQLILAGYKVVEFGIFNFKVTSFVPLQSPHWGVLQYLFVAIVPFLVKLPLFTSYLVGLLGSLHVLDNMSQSTHFLALFCHFWPLFGALLEPFFMKKLFFASNTSKYAIFGKYVAKYTFCWLYFFIFGHYLGHFQILFHGEHFFGFQWGFCKYAIFGHYVAKYGMFGAIWPFFATIWGTISPIFHQTIFLGSNGDSGTPLLR